MPHNVRVNRLIYILLHEDTTLLRLFFGIASLAMGAWIGLDEDFHLFHENSLRFSPQWVTAMMFLAHGTALIYGAITSRYSILLLGVEGLVGTFAWCAFAYSDMLDHGGFTPAVTGALMAFLLLVRYPTHYPVQGGKDAIE